MKKLNKLILFLFLLLIPALQVSAYSLTGRAINSGTNIRSGASTSFSILGKSEYGKEFKITAVIPSDNIGSCSSNWYKFDYKEQDGYICGDYVNLYVKKEPVDDSTVDVEETEEEKLIREQRETYEKSLKELGFPDSYIPYLSLLHETHPNWIFEPLQTGIKFDAAVKAESALGVSLIEDDDAPDGWKTTLSPAYDYKTDKWKSYDSGSWVAVNEDVVAYFLDPRNFLNDIRIFQFEKLNFDETYQTLEAVQSVFGEKSIFYPVANAFIEAGKTYDVNSVYLAAKVRGEVGVNGSGSTSGGSFTYDGVKYEGGYYNVYNIGAYKTSAGSAIARGLYWAMGGFGIKENDKYLRPWTSLELSIKGGAYYIANGYINNGQYTTYLQRFNVAKGYVGTSHQYMTDIRSPYSASKSSYKSYYNNDLLETSFKFTIPIFDEMPEYTFLPAEGNPNHHLSDLKVNGESVSNFSHDVNEYTFYVRSGATNVTIEATTVNKNATLAGTGAVMLTGDTTDCKIEVTAENGEKNTYIIHIVKSGTIEMTPDEIINESALKKNGSYISGIALGSTVENLTTMLKEVSVGASISVKTSSGEAKEKGILGTGDVITVTNGEKSGEYTLVIYGDTSGDGEISVLDLVRVQKHILGYSTLNGAFGIAADTSKEGNISVLDLVKIQKHILEYSEIKQ